LQIILDFQLKYFYAVHLKEKAAVNLALERNFGGDSNIYYLK
jgi:hypothetical protein